MAIVPVEDTRNRRKLGHRRRFDDTEPCVNRATEIANSTGGLRRREEEEEEEKETAVRFVMRPPCSSDTLCVLSSRLY